MKVVASTTNAAVIETATARFWELISQNCNWWVVNGPGLELEPYGSEALQVWSEGQTWGVFGQSCAGNWCSIKFDGRTLTVEINSRRHALLDSGNMAGHCFLSIFSRVVTRPSGYIIPYNPPVPGTERITVLSKDMLMSLEVLVYQSQRRDRPFWECGLDPHLTGIEYRRAKTEGRV